MGRGGGSKIVEICVTSFMDDPYKNTGGAIIEEGDEIDSSLNEQIFGDLKSLIDDVIGLQSKPAVCTLTVERYFSLLV